MTTSEPRDPVVLVGVGSNGETIVRWFPDVWSAERNHVMMSASASGVRVHDGYLHEIPEPWLLTARQVYAQLSDDAAADVSSVATHMNSVVSNGPLVPVSKSHG